VRPLDGGAERNQNKENDMKKILYALAALLVVGGLVTGGVFTYIAISDNKTIADLQATLATANGEVHKANVIIADQGGTISLLTKDKAKLSSDLDAAKADNSKLTSDLGATRSQLTDARKYEGILFCGGTNRKWSITSVDDALAKLDTLGEWDFRSGQGQSFKVWTNTSAQYITVLATQGGTQYGYPFLIFPVADFGRSTGIWDLTNECWVSLN
jgi:hypothetical protein